MIIFFLLSFTHRQIRKSHTIIFRNEWPLLLFLIICAISSKLNIFKEVVDELLSNKTLILFSKTEFLFWLKFLKIYFLLKRNIISNKLHEVKNIKVHFNVNNFLWACNELQGFNEVLFISIYFERFRIAR